MIWYRAHAVSKVHLVQREKLEKGYGWLSLWIWGRVTWSVILFHFTLCWETSRSLSHVLGITRVGQGLMEEEECQENLGQRSGAHLFYSHILMSVHPSELCILKQRFSLWKNMSRAHCTTGLDWKCDEDDDGDEVDDDDGDDDHFTGG